MTDVGFTNYNLLARSLDTNKDGVMNELQMSNDVKQRIDTDGDGKVTQKELAISLRSDAVEVNRGQVVHGKGFNIHTEGLETLRNINSIADRSTTYAFQSSYDHLKGQARVDAIKSNNREYSYAIRQMESSLRTIRDMTRYGNDSISNNIQSMSRNALADVNYTRMIDFFNTVLDNPNSNSIYDDPFSNSPSGEPDTSGLERQNQNLRYAYESLNSALRNIENSTDNLPDVKQAIRTTDNSLTNAYSNLVNIRSNTQTPTQVKQKLYVKADAEQAQVKGRALPFAGVGAGIGAVAGGAIGYFAGGQNAKAALIGVGIGLSAGAGISALIGKSIDKKHENNASELKQLGDEIERYNPDEDENKLQSESGNLYNELLNIRGKHDIDNARASTNNINTVNSRVKDVENRTSRILKGYNIK